MQRDVAAYTLRGPEDFVRLDSLCVGLLREFVRWLQTPAGGSCAPDRAGPLAHAADRYVRDFVVEIKETGPADEDPTLARQYVGNWYVIHTLTPTHEEVGRILDALSRLYGFLAERGIVARATAEAVRAALRDAEIFHRRLEDFWALTPEGIAGWRAVDDYRRRPHG